MLLFYPVLLQTTIRTSYSMKGSETAVVWIQYCLQSRYVSFDIKYAVKDKEEFKLVQALMPITFY
jgi:hypothetical protein